MIATLIRHSVIPHRCSPDAIEKKNLLQAALFRLTLAYPMGMLSEINN